MGISATSKARRSLFHRLNPNDGFSVELVPSGAHLTHINGWSLFCV
jgi:hypothetical protein